MRKAIVAIAVLVTTPLYAQTDTSSQRGAMPKAFAIENQPCCDKIRGTPSVNSDDATVLAALPDRAVRDGKILRLKLEGNRSIKITDCGDDEDVCRTPENFVVHAGFYESQGGYLIRETDGLVVGVPAPPILSPDERYAVSSDPSVANGGGAVSILDMRFDPPAVLPEKESTTCPLNPQKFGLVTWGNDVKWIDNMHVLFGSPSFMQDAQKPRELLLHVIDGGAEWECRF